ncbi:unnamed protein product, partial [Urochloa humidicola]
CRTGRRGQATAAAVLPHHPRTLPASAPLPGRLPPCVPPPGLLPPSAPPSGHLQEAALACTPSSGAACPRPDGSPAPVRRRHYTGPCEPPATVPPSEAEPAPPFFFLQGKNERMR